MKRQTNPLDTIRKAQAEAAERRRMLVEKMSTRHKPKQSDSAEDAHSDKIRFPPFDIDRAIAAAGRLHLVPIELDVGTAQTLNRPTIAVLKEFLYSIAKRDSAVILQWPTGERDISLLHPLAMLALLGEPKKYRTNSAEWCDPSQGCRTLYFPWRSGATAARQKSLLARRCDILDWNKYHLMRQHMHGESTTTVMDKLHLTLGHLNQLSKRDQSKPHLAHPTLAESYPVFCVEAGDEKPEMFRKEQWELFGRVRFGAALDRQTDYRNVLSAPETAPFGLFGVSPAAPLRRALSAPVFGRGDNNPQSPDVCLLDLAPPSINRLGANWEKTVKRFVNETRQRFPDIPFFVVTQDAYVHRRMAGMLRSVSKTNTVRSRVVVRVSQDPLADDPAVKSVTSIAPEFVSVAGPTTDAITALSKAARGSSDPTLEGTLRRAIGALRKAASLPCGLAQAYEVLCHEVGQFSAESFLQYRSRGTLLSPLKEALASEIGGAERTRVTSALDAVERAFDTLDQETPVGSLVAELAETLSRKSSRTLIVFGSEYDCLLGRDRLVRNRESGVAIGRKIDRGHLRLTSIDTLESVLSEIEVTKERNGWKRLVLVSPSFERISIMLTRGWLPDELIVVCERSLAKRVSENYRRLSSHPDLSGEERLGNRLSQTANAARLELDARKASSLELELDESAGTNPDNSVIDMTDGEADDNSKIVIITLATKRTLRARENSTIIRYNHGVEVNPFERASARHIKNGEAIVVPDQTFLEEAREFTLPIRVLAQNWTVIYHTTVQTQLPNIPGNSLNEKAKYVLNEIRGRGGKTQTQAAVLNWLKVEEHMQVDAERRQPHAPQRRNEFDVFMAILGVNDELSERMWVEGIQPLRIDRRRAGYRMAQAFVSLLVDPHGTTSGLDPSVRSAIKTLRNRSLDYLDQVVSMNTIDGSERHD